MRNLEKVLKTDLRNVFCDDNALKIKKSENNV